MKDFITGIPQGLRNLIYYFRVIWQDRDWDYRYTEDLLLRKYERQYKHLKARDMFVDSEEYCQALRICINILRRRQQEWYLDMWHERDGQYKNFDLVPSDRPGYLRLEITPKVERPFAENYWREARQSIEVRDWDLYCKLVHKYHQHWWD